MLNLGQNWWFFILCDHEISEMTLKNNRALLLCYVKLCASFKSISEFKLELQSRCLNSGQNWWLFVLCNLKDWWITLKNNRAPLLYYIKLCASFQTHGWIQTGITVRKCSIRIKISVFLSCVIMKLEGWPWKTIRHLFYISLSFVHHFKAIGEFKQELQSRNAQFFVLWDLEIWRMTSKDNMIPLLCYFKLCASFRSHRWILKTGVIVWKCPISVKIEDFF